MTANSDSAVRPRGPSDPGDELTRDISDSEVASPSAFPGTAIAGGLLGLGMLAVCGVLIRDLLVRTGALSGDTWTHRAAASLSTQIWSEWMWVIPAGCVVVGLAGLWLAVKPRRITHLSLADYPVMWTRPVDLARRVSAAVSDLPGVRTAVTVVGRRTITVTVTAVHAVDRDDVARCAARAAGTVAPGKRVKVRIRDGRKGTVR